MLLPVVLLSGFLLACMSGTDQEVSQAFNTAMEERGSESSGIKKEIDVLSEQDNSAHQITAAFILQQNGMDSDLESYDDVRLVSYVDSSGEERFSVVVDQKDVYFHPDAP
jgi:hypothetical protein